MQRFIDRAAFPPVEHNRIDRNHPADPVFGKRAVEGEVGAAAAPSRNDGSFATPTEKIERSGHVVILRRIVKNLIGRVFDRGLSAILAASNRSEAIPSRASERAVCTESLPQPACRS